MMRRSKRRNLQHPTNIYHAFYLDSDHVLVSRADQLLSETDLRSHLIGFHDTGTRNKNKRELAWLHLLAHTLSSPFAAPFRQKLGIPDEWGHP